MKPLAVRLRKRRSFAFRSKASVRLPRRSLIRRRRRPLLRKPQSDTGNYLARNDSWRLSLRDPGRLLSALRIPIRSGQTQDLVSTPRTIPENACGHRKEVGLADGL